VKLTFPVFPLGVTTWTFLEFWLALPEIVNVAVTVVSFTTVTPLTVTPFPDTFTPVAPVKSVPVSVTVNPAPPRACEAGLIDVKVGDTTVKVTALLVPPGVVTVTFLSFRLALPEIVNVAVTVVSFTTVTPLTVMPFPDTCTAVAPVRFVPVSVTANDVSRDPVAGAIDINFGAGTAAPMNSTAPMSIRVPGVGLGLP
jgi:hypothetical protein